MATLYEMTQAATALYELLQAEEIDEQTVADTLEGMGVKEKLEAYCQIIRQMDEDADMFKAEIERLQARKKTAENAKDRMKDALLAYMSASGQKKTEAGTFQISVSVTKSVQVNDEAAVPERFKIPQPDKIDKIGIRDAIKAGETVEGCEMVEKEGVRIR